jgi:archaellum component FlaC
MDVLIEKIDQINIRLDKIEKKLGIVEQDCSSMRSHIGFVESVYDTLKTPLNYITSKISGESRELPPPPPKKILDS